MYYEVEDLQDNEVKVIAKISTDLVMSKQEFMTVKSINSQLPKNMQRAFPKIIGGGEFIVDD